MASAGPGELKVSPPQPSAPPGKAGRPFRRRGGGGSLEFSETARVRPVRRQRSRGGRGEGRRKGGR